MSTDAVQLISQGYPLWAVLDRAFDAAAKYDSSEDFAYSLGTDSPGGPFPVIGWEYEPGQTPRPILAVAGVSADVVVVEGSYDLAIRAAVKAFQTQQRERKSAEGSPRA